MYVNRLQNSWQPVWPTPDKRSDSIFLRSDRQHQNCGVFKKVKGTLLASRQSHTLRLEVAMFISVSLVLSRQWAYTQCYEQ